MGSKGEVVTMGWGGTGAAGNLEALGVHFVCTGTSTQGRGEKNTDTNERLPV